VQHFSNTILQKLANTYNNCIFKLLNISEIRTTIVNTRDDFNKWNNILEKYNLNGFQHRLVIRLCIYIQKNFCYSSSPTNLANCFTVNNKLNKSYNLRNLLDLKIPDKGKYNDFGEETFEYFFSKFINSVINEIISYGFRKYIKYVKQNPNHLLLKTINTFQKFDLKFKIFYLSKKQKKIYITKFIIKLFSKLINEYRSTLLVQRPRR
jgi:hypothetical protein